MHGEAKPNNGGDVYEMLWDCKFCGTKKLLGKTHRHCPSCGGLQDPTWRYFPSDEEKVAVADHIYTGADKICPACKTPNGAAAEFCGSCGSPLDKAASAQLAGERRKREGEAFETENRKERQEASQKATTASSAKSGGSKRLGLILLGVAVLVIGGILFTVLSSKTAPVYVTGHRWEREIRINSLQSVSASSDCDSVPAGAYNTDRRYEKVDTKSVPDGETCETRQIDQGDGTFREQRDCTTKYRQEDVFGYVCYYDYNQWAYSRSANAQGVEADVPTWPETNLRSGSCLGCEQEAGRDERYFLLLKGDGDRNFECEVAKPLWDESTLERGFEVKFGTVLNDVRCDTLKPLA